MTDATDAVDAAEIVHVLRTVRDRFPDGADVLGADALAYCAWNQLIAQIEGTAVVTAKGAEFLGKVGLLYPEHTDG
jgi:hypothetical protein